MQIELVHNARIFQNLFSEALIISQHIMYGNDEVICLEQLSKLYQRKDSLTLPCTTYYMN